MMYGTKSHVKITAGWGFLRVEGLVVTNEGFKFSVGCVVIYMMVCVCCNYSTISGGFSKTCACQIGSQTAQAILVQI